MDSSILKHIYFEFDIGRISAYLFVHLLKTLYFLHGFFLNKPYCKFANQTRHVKSLEKTLPFLTSGLMSCLQLNNYINTYDWINHNRS